jgi:ribosomal protein S18 acetylase RimI-like enzyme
MAIRHLESSDFDFVSEVVDEWWGGRPVRGLLPRLFFEHFRPSSFALETNGAIEGFVVGFRSQSSPSVGYIHFVGVSPNSRGRGYGRMLYDRFFEAVAGMGCQEVRCITSPLNSGSIAFHRRMGFEILPGNGKIDDLSVVLNHAGKGEHRVLFRKELTSS